jgi:hypothetical protein
MRDGLLVKLHGRQRRYSLSDDQSYALVQIVRERLGDKLSRSQFDDAILRLFEDIAGFETLPSKVSQRYIWTLWQCYQTAFLAPKRNTGNEQ